MDRLEEIKTKAKALDERGGQTYLADPKEILWLVAQARAASNLLKELDSADPSWRKETLYVEEDGDDVNFAWDALVAACEKVEPWVSIWHR